ncbi:protein ASPARTIC PROTEASE IN GUARD CELL 1-like [Silene latifolia]|uniref:protein ASPARTIC PROTEASE IN GUARD CELL 1-like n=1 Tax=Silene latifolia TaxID=37657 RepID=UPI003D7857B2
MLGLTLFTFLFLLLPLELVSQSSSESSEYIRTPVLGSADVFSLLYYTKIGVGTFDATPSFKNYFLAIDTGSSLTWLQCEACRNPGNHCFQQLKPPFPNSNSHTYSPLTSCESQRQATSSRGSCIGHMEYNSGEKTQFEVAHEHFILETNVHKSFKTVKLEFGCGFNQTGFNEITKPGIMTGILGLSRDQMSFQFQIDTESGKGLNFSYCFPILTKRGGPTTYLTFGKNIPSRSGFSVTPLLSIPGDELYYVKMFDILVNGHPLHIDPSYFDVRKNGGVFLDTGSSISALVQPVYDTLERRLMTIFSANPNFHRKAVMALTCLHSAMTYRKRVTGISIYPPSSLFSKTPHLSSSLVRDSTLVKMPIIDSFVL